MLITVRDLHRHYKIQPMGVLHVGAHLAEEADAYLFAGWAKQNKIIWIESQPQLIAELRKKLNINFHEVIEATVWSKSAEKLTFKITNNSQSSSLLNLGTHELTYPEVKVVSNYEIETTTLKDLFPSEITFDFINLDIQGSELEALKGFGKIPSSIKWIYAEINKEYVYENCATVDELDEYLREQGLYRVATQWAIKKGWGDALYARPNSIKFNLTSRIAMFSKYKIAKNLRGLLSAFFS